MNASLRTVLSIGGTVLLAAAIGAAVFVFTGATEVVWATMIGIPLLVVLGMTLYVRGLITRNKTSEQQYVRKRGRSVAELFQEHLRTLNDLQQTYPSWSPNLDARRESLIGDFRKEGVEFDPNSGSFELTDSVDSADVEEFERLETEADMFHNEYKDRFEEFVRSELSEIETAIERLEAVDLVDRTPSVESPPAGASLPTFQDTLDEHREVAETSTTAAIETVREMSRGENRPDDIEFIEDELEAAETARDQHEYTAAADSILEARDRLREQFSGSFDTERTQLLDLLDAVLDSKIDQYVDADYVNDVEAMKRDIEALDSALEITELTRKRTQLRETCIAIIRSLERDLDDAVRTLQGEELPAGYYTVPEIVDESPTRTLENSEEFATFTAEWADSAARLTDALEEASTKASVVSAYDDFSKQIETELQQTGEVTADDLPVRHAEQFLGLYNRQNPSVEYNPTTETLRRGDVDQYEVTVTVQYERGGDPRMATVTLDGANYSEQRQVETRVSGEVAFTDAPHGTYTLVAEPGADEFAPVSREIVVDKDTNATVEFAEQSVRERLCAEFDQDMEEHIPAIDSQVSSTFEEQGYVSTDMELPVRAEYEPCLMATWGEQNGYDVTERGQEIIVYDRGEVRRELENVVRYNISAGEELGFDEVRTKFLTVPIPDETIRDIVNELQIEADVTTTPTSITTH